jgi:hypothetical protein
MSDSAHETTFFFKKKNILGFDSFHSVERHHERKAMCFLKWV